MNWSWRIGRVSGIALHLHATFLILVAYVAFTSYRQRQSWEDAFAGVLFILAFFGIVVLHELGHCLTARRFGIGTRDITLLPVGGLARLERMPEKPGQELLIAVAGPAVNVGIGVLLYLLLPGIHTGRPLDGLRFAGGQLLVNLFYANALMAVFNLAPAFPMDGGRVLRALFALRMDYARATETAATVGQAIAWGAGSVGLFTQQWWLLIIAVFVFLGAETEAEFVKTRAAFGAGRVADVMARQFQTLTVADPLAVALRHSLAGFQQDFPVVNGGRVVGVLTRRRLLAGLSTAGDAAPVGDFMQRDFRTAFAWEPISEAFQRLQDCECRALPVLQDGTLVGVLTADTLGEQVMIRAALGERRNTPGAASPPAA